MNVPPSSGLRPVARRFEGGPDMSRQTRRIVMPPVEKKATPDAPGPVPQIAAVARAPVAAKHFYVFPCVDPALMGAFPHGIRLSSEWLYIGRNPYTEVDAFLALVVNRDGVSKLHAALTEYMGKIFVTDLGSSNGTVIIRDQHMIEVRQEMIEIRPNDILGIGPVLFRIVSQ